MSVSPQLQSKIQCYSIDIVVQICGFIACYSYNRLKMIKEMRWEFGSVLPPDIKYNLCEAEVGVRDGPSCPDLRVFEYRISAANS